MTIHLSPEQEQAIQAAISSGRFASVDEFIDVAIRVIEPPAANTPTRRADLRNAPPVTEAGRKKAAELRAWLAGHKPTPLLSEEAVSRALNADRL